MTKPLDLAAIRARYDPATTTGTQATAPLIYALCDELERLRARFWNGSA